MSLQLPDIYEFPPFFTRQTNESTWSHQLATWKQIICDFCRAYKVYRLDVAQEISGTFEDRPALFRNDRIHRQLKPEMARALIDALVADDLAEWDGDGNVALVYGHKIADWAHKIGDWVEQTGQSGSVLTLYEISEGETAEGREFYGLPLEVVRKIVDEMAKRGKAVVLKGGVKML